MADYIRTREEKILAKVAGKQIDLSDMRPPAGTGAAEALLLEIAERIENIEKALEAGTD